MHCLTPDAPKPKSAAPTTATIKQATTLALRLFQLTILQSASQDDWLDTATHDHILVRLSVPPTVKEFLSDANRIHWRKVDELSGTPGTPDLSTIMPPADLETSIFSHLVYLGIQHLMTCDKLSTKLDSTISDIETQLTHLLDTLPKEPKA